MRHFCFILSTGAKIQIDSVMRPLSTSRRRNTSASVTVTVIMFLLSYLLTYLLTYLNLPSTIF